MARLHAAHDEQQPIILRLPTGQGAGLLSVGEDELFRRQPLVVAVIGRPAPGGAFGRLEGRPQLGEPCRDRCPGERLLSEEHTVTSRPANPPADPSSRTGGIADLGPHDRRTEPPTPYEPAAPDPAWRRAKPTNCVRTGSISTIRSSMRRSAVSTYASRRRELSTRERYTARHSNNARSVGNPGGTTGHGCAAARPALIHQAAVQPTQTANLHHVLRRDPRLREPALQ